MKSNYMICAILVFGVLVAITAPHLVNIALKGDNATYETDVKSLTTSAEYQADLAAAIPVAEEKVTVNEEIAPDPEKVEPLPEEENVPTKEVLQDPIVYDGMTLKQLTDKFNRILKSTLAGTGYYFAKYAIDYGVDPYIAVAITLHETGCNNGSCSSKVTKCNNVGGMKGSPSCNGGSYKAFATLEEGIKGFIHNLKKNYYDKGLTTLEQMNTKYASSKTWATQVNRYVNQIKAA